MRKLQFIDDHIYHVFNRGVDKRDIFLDDQDYFRFIHNLFEFNDENPVTNSGHFFGPHIMDVESRVKHFRRKEKTPRKRLVEILLFTLMPNHFHLLIRQKAEKGIAKFMQKLGTGYTMYFNKRYERDGVLFQGKFKAVFVDRQAHFLYLPSYIHCNPLELRHKYRGSASINWREGMEFLENYRWSSFLDYIGKKNFPSVTQREFILAVFGGEREYKRHTEDLIKELGRGKGEWLERIDDIVLD